MKFFIFYLNFLICFSSLLDQIRKNVVDQSLLKLPKRENIDILKMFLEMSNIKKENSMTDAESAYLVYKWIGQNIEYDCLGNKFGNTTTLPATTYKEGKGGYIGISGLFNTICGFLNIESNTIFGIKKILTQNFTGNLIDLKEYAWNYISIDNQYYLIDITSSLGSCEDVIFYRYQRDNYFGIDPEISIRHLFPNDKKWQLLNEPITESKFKSQSLLYGNFFKIFKNFSPDIQTIKNQKNIKMRLTVKDPNIKTLYFYEAYDESDEEIPFVDSERKVSVVNGTCEYNIYPLGTCYYFIDIYEKKNDKIENYSSITYEVIFDE